LNAKNLHESFFVNSFAYWLLIAKTMPFMQSKNYGRFLSFSSIGSKYGGSCFNFSYTSSKKCLEHFPRAFKELAASNVFINNIITGATDTEFLKSKKNFDLDGRTSLIPTKRLAEPSEIAVIAFNLCSKINTYQTLSNTTIAGGE